MLKNINTQKMNGQNNGNINNNNNNIGKLLPISSTTMLQSTQLLLKKPFPITSTSQEFLTSKSLSSTISTLSSSSSSSGIIVTASTTIIPTLTTTTVSSILSDITTTTSTTLSTKSIKNSIGKLTPKDLLVVSTKKLMDNQQQQQQQQQQQLNQQNIKNNIKSNLVLDNNNIIKKPQTKQDKMEQQKLHHQQQQQQQQQQNQDTEDSRSKKKRCADRYDSSESSDSGVATLSCTDSSTASSDASDPGSPYSPLSGNGDDLQNQSGRKKSLSSSSLSSTSNSTTITTSNTTNTSSTTEGLLTLKNSIPTSIIMPPSQVILAKTKLNESTGTSVVNCNNGKTFTTTTSTLSAEAAAAATTAIATSTTNTALSSIHLKTPSPTTLQINQAIQSQIQHQTQLKQSQSILQQQKINLNLWPWHKVHQNNNNNNILNNNNNNNNKINNNNTINLDKLSSSSSSLTITTTTPTSSSSNSTNTANNQTLNDTQNVTNSTTTSFSSGSINMTSGITNIDSNNLSANNIKINNFNNNNSNNKNNKRSSTQNVNDNINNNNSSCTITTTTANKKSRLNNNNNNSINSNSSNNSNVNANNNNNSNLLINQSIPPLISTTQSVSTITNPIGIIAATSINNSNSIAVQQALKTSLSNTSTVSSTTGIGNKRLKLATNEESQTKITGYFKMKHKSKPLNHAAQPMDIKSITTSTTTTTCITTINTTTVASNNSKTRTISSIPPLLRKIDRSKTKIAQVAPNLRKTTLSQTNMQLPLLAPKSPKKPVAIAPRISDIKSKTNNSLISQSTSQNSQLKATNPILLATSTSTANQSQPPPLQSIDPTKLTVNSAAAQQTAQTQPAVLLTAIRIPQQQAAQLQLANAANSLNKNGNANISNSNQNGKLNQIPTSATLTSATTTNGSLYQIPMMPNLVQIPNIIATANANGGTNLLVQPNGHLTAATRVNNSNMAAAAAAAAAQLQLYGTVLKFQQQIAAAAAAASQSNQQSNNATNNLLTMDPTQLSNLLMKSSITQNVIPLSTINTTTTTVATNQQSKTIATNSVLPNLQQSQAQSILTAQPPQLSRITTPQVFMATSNGYLLNATTLPTAAIFANATTKSPNTIPQTMPALQPIQSSSIQTSNSNQQATNAAASFLPSLSAILQAHQNHQQQAASIILNAAAQLPDSTTGNNFLSAAISSNAQTETKILPPLLPTSNLSSFTTNNTSNAAAVAALAKSGQHPSALGKTTLISTSQVPPPPLVLSNTEIAKKISSIAKPNQRGRKPTSLPTLAATTKPQRKKRVTKNATNVKSQLNQQKIRPKEKIDMVPLVPLVPISNKTTVKLPIDSKTKINFNRSSPPPLEEIKKPINISSSLPPPIVPISREKFSIPTFEHNMNVNSKCDRLPELSFEGKIEKQINEKLIENAERKIDNTIHQQQNCNEAVNETKVNENITHDEDSSNKSTSPLFIENDAHKIKPLNETQKEISDESCSKEATKESFDESIELDDRSECDRSEFEGKLIIKEDMSFGNEMESEFKKQEEEAIEIMQKPEVSIQKDEEIGSSQQNDFRNFEKENFEADIFEDSIKNNFEKIFDGDFEEKLEKKLIAFEEKLRQNYKEQYKENYEANVDAIADEKVKEKFASLSQQIDESIKEDVIKMESSQHLKIFSESSLSSNSSFSISSGVVANAIAAAAAEDTTTSSLHLSIDSQMYDSQLAAEVQVKLQDIAISKSGFFSNATPPCILSSSSSSTTMSSALQSTASICTLGNTFNTSTTTTNAVSSTLAATKIDSNLSIFKPALIDTDMANDITAEKTQSLGVETLQKCAISPILSQPKTIRFPAPGEMGQRFGSKGFKRRDGVCYWDGCNTKHETCSKLLDHMQSFHVNSQTGPFKCLWNGCKVHGRESCSRRWLERHVLSHGGSKMFKCIVDGCGLRFSSQLALQKHVNGHFNTMENKDSNPKRTSDPPMPKQLKKTGKKLRYRLQPFSARMFDYIDSGIMEGLVHRLRIRTAVNGAPGDHLVFSGHPIARRTNPIGIKEVLVRWTPCGIIDNEWVLEPKETGPESIIKRMKYTEFSCDEKINLNNYLRSANLHTDICTMTKRNSLAAFSFVSHNEIINKLFGDFDENININTKILNNNRFNNIFDSNNDFDDEPSMSSTSTTTTLDSILSSQISDENDYSGDSCYSTSTKCSGNNKICMEKELRFTERLNRKQSRKPRKLNTEPS